MHRLTPPRRRPVVTACCAAASAFVQTVAAQEEPKTGAMPVLDAVVVTASQREQAIKEAPASISVITRKEIESQPYTSVSEIISRTPGVDLSGESPNTKDISIRGMPGEYTLILVDGKRQNTRETMNRGTSGVQANLLPPLSAIERIEVVRGPMSSLYGADAMGGVVNIITRKVPEKWSGTVSLGAVWQHEGHLGNTTSADFWLGGPIKSDVLGLQVSGSTLKRGEDAAYYPNNGTTGSFEQRVGNFDVKLSAKPASNQDVSVNIGREQLTHSTTPGISSAPLTPRSAAFQSLKSTHSRNYWGLTHDGRWSFGKTSLALYGEKGQQENWLLAGKAPVEPTVSNTVLEGKAMIPWAKGRNLLTVGAQHTWSKLSGAGRQDVVPTGYPINSNSIQKNSWALFAENDFFFNDKLTLTTGLRLDHDDNYGNHVSPRVYGVYQMTPEWTLRGGISTGFKAPTLRQSTAGYCMTTGGAAGAVPGTLCGNPALKPESSITQEVGIRYDKDSDYASLTLFNNMFKNKVASYDIGKPDPLSPGRNIYVYDNISRVKLYGLELSGGKQLTSNVRVSGGYTLTESRRQGGGESSFNGKSLDGRPLDKTPKHKLNAQVDWSPTPSLNLYASANHIGKQYWAGFRNAAVDVRERPATTTFDLGGKWTISKHLDFAFAVHNLTNKQVAVDPRGRYDGLNGNWQVDEGRRLALKLTAQF